MRAPTHGALWFVTIAGMIPVHAIVEKPITEKSSENKAESWTQELASAFTQPAELLAFLGLDDRPHLVSQANKANTLFKMRVPLSYAQKMQPNNERDPLLKQVLPMGEEFFSPDGYMSDPVGDTEAEKTTGLLHKYKGRVLLVTTGICAVNCRYCFRREYPYETNSASQSQWDDAFEYIAGDDSIKEVILSGGDPLTLSDKRLGKLFERIHTIKHIKRIRIHTRLPVVLPARITPKLLQLCQNSPCQIIMVVHCNHANEIQKQEENVFNALNSHGVTCLNQAVLLKDINDSVQVLCDLSERLFGVGVMPYYLHVLDKVKGASHFDCPRSHALNLIEQLKAELPGYLVPKLVQEIAGEPNKTEVTPQIR